MEIKRIDFISSLYWQDIPLSNELKEFCILMKDKDYHNDDLTEQLAKLLGPQDLFLGVAKEQGYKNVNVSKMWIAHYHKGDSHAVHVHGPHRHDWSFILYIDCKDESSETMFYNPGFPYIDNQKVKMKPKVGRLCLFNGGLPHEVLPSTDDTRLIVSGNLIFGHDMPVGMNATYSL